MKKSESKKEWQLLESLFTVKQEISKILFLIKNFWKVG